MKIRYEYDGGSNMLTECPNGMNVKVGSTNCRYCRHFVDSGWPLENYVTCNYKKKIVSIKELKKELAEMLEKSKSLVSKLEKLESLEKQEKGDWVPERGERYWFISTYGAIVPSIWCGGTIQLERLYFHNVYPTEEMAESALHDITRENCECVCELLTKWEVK